MYSIASASCAMNALILTCHGARLVLCVVCAVTALAPTSTADRPSQCRTAYAPRAGLPWGPQQAGHASLMHACDANASPATHLGSAVGIPDHRLRPERKWHVRAQRVAVWPMLRHSRREGRSMCAANQSRPASNSRGCRTRARARARELAWSRNTPYRRIPPAGSCSALRGGTE